jgi:hypothetical protein
LGCAYADGFVVLSEGPDVFILRDVATGRRCEECCASRGFIKGKETDWPIRAMGLGEREIEPCLGQ